MNSCGRLIRTNKRLLVIVISITLIILVLNKFKNQLPRNEIRIRNTNSVNLKELLIASIKAARFGGDEVVAVSRNISLYNKRSKGKTLEGADDVLTEADTRSHCIMKTGLQNHFPKVKIISEEDHSFQRKCSGSSSNHFDLESEILHDTVAMSDEFVDAKNVTVWIDPLDGTQEYTDQLFQYVTTMVCASVNGIPVIGVIHNPFDRKTTWAWVGNVKSEDLSFIRKDGKLVNNPVVIVSRSHAGGIGDTLKKVFGENVDIVPAGGAGYKTLQVVFGKADVYMHTTRIKKWDICAGNAIVKALGGEMTDLSNKQIDYAMQVPINDKGLLAALSNHKQYIEKVSHLKL